MHFLSAYKHVNQFKGHAQMPTWLSAIVKNAAWMQLRRVSRELNTYLDQSDRDSDDQPLSEKLDVLRFSLMATARSQLSSTDLSTGSSRPGVRHGA